VQKLLTPQDGDAARGTEPTLRSGLYVVRSFVSTAEERAYVLYWPEDTTWDDQAISTGVQRNRVMFMRYEQTFRPPLPQFNCIHIGTSPNYVIRSPACFRQNIQKRLCGATWSRDLDSWYIFFLEESLLILTSTLLSEDGHATPRQPTPTAENAYRSQRPVSEAAPWRNQARYHDRQIQACEEVGREYFTK